MSYEDRQNEQNQRHDGIGVGKGHHNRKSRKGGTPPVWFRRGPAILDAIDRHPERERYTRRDIEAMFDVRVTAACKLMRAIGREPDRAEVARRDVRRYVAAALSSAGYEREERRHASLTEQLAEAARAIAARRVVIEPPPPAPAADLPAGVRIARPGLLEVDYRDFEDLVARLYGLVQTMAERAASVHDFEAYREKFNGKA